MISLEAKASVGAHLLVHSIDPAGDGPQPASPAGYGVEGMEGYAGFLQNLAYDLLTVVKLISDQVEPAQLFQIVLNVFGVNTMLVFIEAQLGRCGAGVDYENAIGVRRHDYHLSC
jgi:hypothetical protein